VIKRALDVVVSFIALVVLSPVLFVVALVVAGSMGSPVLFRQVRPGRHGRLFGLLKFRTMSDARDATGALRPDAERLTGVGRFLRRTSLDELPELWNVLWGDMSLVGPRPLLPSYLDRYNARQARRHDVRPGLTGLAQVNGRNALDWKSRLELDVRYVETQSMALDMKILLQTIGIVLRGSGVSQPGHATAEEFRGDAEGGPDGV
jgi:sugar transferase EpsL